MAIDFSAQMLKQAQSRTPTGLTQIRYSAINATDYDALLPLGQDSFDETLCNMALFDMAEIPSLMRALHQLIRSAGQPVPHLSFHRSLSELLGAGFKAGFLLNAPEEHAFPSEDPSGSSPLSWGGNFSEIPPILVTRMKCCKIRGMMGMWRGVR